VCSGPEDGLQSVGSVELLVDIIDIGLNLTEADIQLLSYFFIAGSGCNTNKHFALFRKRTSWSILVSIVYPNPLKPNSEAAKWGDGKTVICVQMFQQLSCQT
jgi:hypothetical protein